ncbi:hypothetical protein [Haloarchaeobius baliensis]|uniref:hypothetical protein n=1 Tax=Haloarchaeobius baliensis TaxID=1670458 RepID=UPI003F88427E
MATDESDENSAEWEIHNQDQPTNTQPPTTVHPLDRADDSSVQSRTKSLFIGIFLLYAVTIMATLANPLLGIVVAFFAGYISLKMVVREMYKIAEVAFEAAQIAEQDRRTGETDA